MDPVSPYSENRGHEQSGSRLTLVSNLGEMVDPPLWETVGPKDGFEYVLLRGFTTGGNEGGYRLSSVVAFVKDVGYDDRPNVSIYATDASGNPGSKLYTLNNPTSFTDGALNSFSAPWNSELEKQTDYFVVFENHANTATQYQVGFAEDGGEDTDSAQGWELAAGNSPQMNTMRCSWASRVPRFPIRAI